jgi:hypothetical protein
MGVWIGVGGWPSWPEPLPSKSVHVDVHVGIPTTWAKHLENTQVVGIAKAPKTPKTSGFRRKNNESACETPSPEEPPVNQEVGGSSPPAPVVLSQYLVGNYETAPLGPFFVVGLFLESPRRTLRQF